MQDPLISVCIPVYNGANYIERALGCMRDQTFDDYEVIVTDNCSTDNTQEIVERWAKDDGRIRYVKNETNIGAAENYNKGFHLARGKYLKWLAHDDEITPNFLEKTLEVLEEYPDAVLAFCPSDIIDGEGKNHGPALPDVGEVTFDSPVERFRRGLYHSQRCHPFFGLFRLDALAKTSLHRSYYSSDRGLLVETLLLGNLRYAYEARHLNREHSKQSINIQDRKARSVWQGGTASSSRSLEKVHYYRHLLEIVDRHASGPERRKLRRLVFASFFRPKEIGRLSFEFAQMIAPGPSLWMFRQVQKVRQKSV